MTEEQMKKKLWDMADLFKHYMRKKMYAMAKFEYEKARSVAIFMELPEEEMDELFGERGNTGEIIKKGLFAEEEVIRAYEKAAVRGNNGHENYKYER